LRDCLELVGISREAISRLKTCDDIGRVFIRMRGRRVGNKYSFVWAQISNCSDIGRLHIESHGHRHLHIK